MIRDPSDGSVRAPQKSAPDVATSQLRAERDPAVMPDWPGADTNSGLPLASTKPENIARLEKSREWLKQYFHRKTEGT
jgi:hypothetical protein